MRIRNRRVIISLIPNLLSPDPELVKMALTMLLSMAPIQNLNKHYLVSFRNKWPGFTNTIPNHLVNASKRTYVSSEITVKIKDYLTTVVQMPCTTNYELDQFFESVFKSICLLDAFLNKRPDFFHSKGKNRINEYRFACHEFSHILMQAKNDSFTETDFYKFRGKSRQTTRIEKKNHYYRTKRQELLKRKQIEWQPEWAPKYKNIKYRININGKWTTLHYNNLNNFVW